MNLYVHFGVVSGLKTTAGNGITAPRVLWAGATVVRDWTESFDDEKKKMYVWWSWLSRVTSNQIIALRTVTCMCPTADRAECSRSGALKYCFYDHSYKHPQHHLIIFGSIPEVIGSVHCYTTAISKTNNHISPNSHTHTYCQFTVTVTRIWKFLD